MTKFLAGVLSVIAAGVLLIAYGLLSPRVGASASPADTNPFARPMFANEQGLMRDDPYAARYAYGNAYIPQAPYGYNYPSAPQAVPVSDVRPMRTVTTTAARERTVPTRLEPRRNWKKTALIIGGSTAGGAGLGGILGGKKGALIGAAIGGGASSIYEATKK
jgi:hypothetical protein